jgi:hypothetical protein
MIDEDGARLRSLQQEKGPARALAGPFLLFEKLGRCLSATLIGLLVDLPLTLTPVPELPTGLSIARVLRPCCVTAPTTSGIC